MHHNWHKCYTNIELPASKEDTHTHWWETCSDYTRVVPLQCQDHLPPSLQVCDCSLYISLTIDQPSLSAPLEKPLASLPVSHSSNTHTLSLSNTHTQTYTPGTHPTRLCTLSSSLKGVPWTRANMHTHLRTLSHKTKLGSSRTIAGQPYPSLLPDSL